MKLLLDLQGAQSQSRQRGIGRYTLALSRALLEQAAPQHDVRLLFNTRFEQPTDALIATLGQHARPERRVMLDVPEGIRAQPGGNPWLRQAAARTMRHALEHHDADVVWFSSMLEGYNDDALLPDAPPAGMACVATLYDLIPLHNAEAYLGHPRVREWYEQSVQLLRRCDLLLAISGWVRQDAIERLKLPADRVVNIGAAVGESFRAPAPNPAASAALHRRHGIVRPYVLYNGGFDARKNVARLIEAFAALPEPLRAQHQLVIVGRASEEERVPLDAAMRRAMLPAQSLVYTGFVSDEDLIRLYAECALFVFPSLYEGFGLPPLEAMACGAPVIASHTASLPEVIDRHDALFDPGRVDSICERMTKALGDSDFNAELRRYAKQRAASFSWNVVADRALEAIQALVEQHPSPRAPAAPSTDPRIISVTATGTRAPAWLDELGATAMTAAQLSSNDASLQPSSSDQLLYIVDPRSAKALEPVMRIHPGAVLIKDGAQNSPAASNAHDFQAVYHASGYPGLLALRTAPDVPAATLIAALQHVVGVMCSDESTARPLREQAIAMSLPEIHVLPIHDAARACRQHLAGAYATHPLAREATLFDEIAAIPGKPDDHDLAAIASTIVAMRTPGRVQRWLVDVSSIANKDIQTGVQRVVRNTLLHWLTLPPAGVRVEPIRFSGGRFRYARRYALDLLDLAEASLTEDAVEIANGDTFIGLDWAVDTMAQAEPQLRDWHRRGVSLHFTVNDLLPLTLPQMFHPYARSRFEDWLRRIASMADQLICISRATSSELSAWMSTAGLSYQFGTAPRVSHSPLGVDTTLAARTSALRKELDGAMQARPTVLMVGTIEPRKGYDQALDACERLWNEGADFNLVIVGHFGWLMDAFSTRVQAHAQRSQRLFWIDDAADGELDAIYQASSLLLAASWGEGYGLPLIEAARRGLPVLARDLPVFREVMGEHAGYFSAQQGAELAEALRSALASPPTPPLSAIFPSWQQSAAMLAQTISAQPHHSMDK